MWNNSEHFTERSNSKTTIRYSWRKRINQSKWGERKKKQQQQHEYRKILKWKYKRLGSKEGTEESSLPDCFSCFTGNRTRSRWGNIWSVREATGRKLINVRLETPTENPQYLASFYFCVWVLLVSPNNSNKRKTGREKERLTFVKRI